MSLVTGVSIAFLMALTLALTGFSASLYDLVGFRPRLALEQELEAALDRFPQGAGGQEGRVTRAIFPLDGRRADNAPMNSEPSVLDGRDPSPLAVDQPMTIEGPDGLRWRVLVRKAGNGRPSGGPHEPRGKEHSPKAQANNEPRAPGPIARQPRGERSTRWRPRFDGWGDSASGLAGPLDVGHIDWQTHRPSRSRPAGSHGGFGPRHALR